MKKLILSIALCCAATNFFAQNADPAQLVNDGKAALEAKNYQEAYTKFSTYLTQTNNQDSVIAYNCGVCADKIKKPAEALKYFDIAVQKKYNLANAYIGKAGALKDLKKNDEYVATLKEGLEANPGNKTLTKLYATYYVNQGIMAQKAKKMDAAEEAFKQAIAIQADNVNALNSLFTCIATVVRAQQMSELENQIDSLLNGKKATVGIAVWTDKGDMLRYNDHVHFPLLSVFKFHVALAVLDKMDKQSISLDSIVSIKASQMPPNTYSPLRKKFPDQDFTITLRELMQYSISQSDNNACDILIEYAGGIKHINDYIHRLSIDSFNLSETEDGMHSSFEAVYRNWSTPSAMVRLLRTADEKELFSNKELKDFLWQTMIDTETGANKLKGMLPAKTVVGHKTGSSDRNADGMKTADNDAGLVILPDGRKYYIAAFVMDSYETDEDNANIIARISRMVYDAMR